MPHGPLILKNLIIVAALVRLVTKKVDRRVIDAADFFFFGEVLQVGKTSKDIWPPME